MPGWRNWVNASGLGPFGDVFRLAGSTPVPGILTTFDNWLLISEAFADCALDRERGSRAVIYLSSVPAKIKFRNVAMQMLSADVVKRPIDSALEQREGAFDRVTMRAVRLRVLALE
jgi:hypothetical protein